jgi:hypothetical protein
MEHRAWSEDPEVRGRRTDDRKQLATGSRQQVRWSICRMVKMVMNGLNDESTI